MCTIKHIYPKERVRERREVSFAMQISIKTLKGKSINLEVEDSSNTIDVKIHGEPMSELVLRLRPSGQGEAAMRIFVVTLNGRNHTLQVKGTDTIGEVKTKYFEIDGTPVDQQNMILAGLALENSWTVAECGIRHESTIHLTRRLCGC